ncbi:hypothetical protein NKG05_10975 [Oerskovia sp. M15]
MPTKKQAHALENLSLRVETLWQIALRRLTIAESEVRRAVDVWGADDLPTGGAVTREQIEDSLADAKGAYRRLRRVMDAWCALWFWPLTDELTTRTVTADDGAEQQVRIEPRRSTSGSTRCVSCSGSTPRRGVGNGQEVARWRSAADLGVGLGRPQRCRAP